MVDGVLHQVVHALSSEVWSPKIRISPRSGSKDVVACRKRQRAEIKDRLFGHADQIDRQEVVRLLIKPLETQKLAGERRTRAAS